MRERLTYISNARIVGILLVVFGHSYPLTGEIPKSFEVIRNFIYCFHMPLFVFVSAYLVSKTKAFEKYSAKNYLQKRFVKLFLPYIGLSIIGFFPKILMSSFINDKVELSLAYFARTIFIPRENVWGHFWFIPMLFTMTVVSVVYKKIISKNTILAITIWVLSFGLIFLPNLTEWIGINDVKNYLFWYLSGLIVGETDWLEKLRPLLSGSVALGIGLFIFVVSDMKAYNTFVGVFLVVGIIQICKCVAIEKIQIFKVIERYSFSIFLLSWPVQAVVEVAGNRILQLPFVFNMSAMFLAGIFVSLAVVVTAKRISSVPYIGKITKVLGL